MNGDNITAGLARKLPTGPPDMGARLAYHAWAGAVYWSDELPLGLSDDEDDFIRCILRYRTSLITGQPQGELEPYWHAGLRAFPSWVGFSKERLTSDHTVVQFYKRESARAVAHFLREAGDENE